MVDLQQQPSISQWRAKREWVTWKLAKRRRERRRGRGSWGERDDVFESGSEIGEDEAGEGVGCRAVEEG
jgi:hypothetical protein